MKLYLSRTEPLNCLLLDEEGKALYQIRTPGFRKTTTLLRISSESEEFARIHWHLINDTRLIINGVIHEIKDFMPLKSVLST